MSEIKSRRMGKVQCYGWMILASSLVGGLALPGGAQTTPLQPSPWQGEGAKSGLPPTLREAAPRLVQGGTKGGDAKAQPATTISQLNQQNRPATTVKEWVAQIEAAIVQVTGVTLEVRSEPQGERTDAGLDIVLQTADGKPLQVDATKFRQEGNSLIADIPNAVLALPEGQAFAAENPTSDVTSVRVTQQDGSNIRVSVTGNNALPKTEVTLKTGEFAYSLNPDADEPDEEIVVTGEGQRGYYVPDATTGTRTDTPLRDTPRTIQVIPEQVLQDQAITRVTDAVRNVSGVVQDGGFAGTVDQLNIRGFFIDSVFVNGLRTNGSGFSETANIARIEVLRGPASVLFGNVEPGGIINLVTKQPLDRPFYEVGVQAGSYGYVRPTIDLTGPLNPDRTVLYRFNAAYERFDGFRDFRQDVDRIFVAPSLAFRLGDATTLDLDLSYLRDERPFDRGFLAIGRGIVDTPISRFFGEPDDFRRVEEFNLGYRFEHQFSDALKIRNQFRFLSSDELDFRAEPVSLNETSGILSRNFRSNDDLSEVYSFQTDLLSKFTTGSINHNLLVGVDLRWQTSGGTQRRLPGGLTPSLNIFNPVYDRIARPSLNALTNEVRNNSDRTNGFGIVLQDQITISENFKLLLSGRFDSVSQNSTNNRTGETSGQDVTAFTPTIGLVYQPVQPISLYANVAQSFQPNFGTRVDGSFLDPERGTQYEVGIRAELTDRLVASLAAYSITKSNVATTDPANPDFSIPIGEQRSQGLDLNLSGEILPGWNIIASYGLIDAEVTASNDLPVGSRVQNVPANTASLWTTYQIQQGDLQGLGFGAGLFYVDQRAGDFSDTFDLPSYLRTDLAIFYRRDNWRAAINIQNLFDVKYFRANNFGRVAIEPGAPFTVVGSLSVEF